jgi:transposase-like protein
MSMPRFPEEFKIEAVKQVTERGDQLKGTLMSQSATR